MLAKQPGQGAGVVGMQQPVLGLQPSTPPTWQLALPIHCRLTTLQALTQALQRGGDGRAAAC